MPELTEKMCGLVETMVSPIVEYPQDLEVSAFIEQGNTLVIELRVHQDDAGKVIGRQGRIIKSIRTIARAAASRDDVHVEVELIDK